MTIYTAILPPKNTKTLEFIEKANKIHNNKYDYSKTVYINSQTKLVIVCNLHGEFMKHPHSHLYGSECQTCSSIKTGRTYFVKTISDFIVQAKEKHGKDRYNYDKFIYVNAKTKSIIICSVHGEYNQTPDDHLSGSGCIKCGHARTKQTKIDKASIEFSEKSNKVHNNKYTYDQFVYTDSITKSTIICPLHGGFLQTPSYHLIGTGCNRCGELRAGQVMMERAAAEFVERAKITHGDDRYNYDKFIYTGSGIRSTIVCALHGEFKQCPNSHIKGSGCPSCNRQGFLPRRNAYVYIKMIRGNAYEYFTGYGITGDVARRMNAHKRSISRSGHEEQYGWISEEISGALAISIENVIKDKYASNKNITVTGFLRENASPVCYDEIKMLIQTMIKDSKVK